MDSSEHIPLRTRGPHAIEGLGRWLSRVLVLLGVLTCLCAGLQPFGVQVQRGFEEFATALRISRATAAVLALPAVWLGIVWLGRVRANQRAVTGDVVGPAHYLPDYFDLSGDAGAPSQAGAAGLAQEVRVQLSEVVDEVATITSAVERRHGKDAVRPFDVFVILSWLVACALLAFLALGRAFELDLGLESSLPDVPPALLYLACGLGALWTAAVVRRITRWQVQALPPRARRAAR